ncbi:hydroxyacid dehydrogenase [Myceligenerans cantabricum]
MSSDVAERLFPPGQRTALDPAVLLLTPEPLSAFDGAVARAVLRETEVLITGWGCPPVDTAVLDRAPRLTAIVHTGGTVKDHLTAEVWERGIVVTSAASVNALPVAEYTLAMILLANKRVIDLSRLLGRTQRFDPMTDLTHEIGNLGKRVGLVGASAIGRRVIELLRPFDLDVAVADPYLSAADATVLGVTRLELRELVATSDIVSLHAPALPETRHLIDREMIRTMKPGATLINTARGSLVDQQALTERLATGDVYAVLDVTDPWIPARGDRLYDLPNVLLTPHIAGSLGSELRRLAAAAVDEARRIADGRPPRHAVRVESLVRLA